MEDYAYTKQFSGNLRSLEEPVPVRVETTLLVMIEESARELREFASHTHGAPQYVFHQSQDLPLHPTLKAIGRHYFTW